MSTPFDDRTKADPCLFLNDECMAHVLSFVGGKTKKADPVEKTTENGWIVPVQGRALSAKDAALLCFLFASVSKHWKRVVSKSVASIVGVPLQVVIGPKPRPRTVRKMISWLCQHKLSIGKFAARRVSPGLAQAFASLLRDCDTSQLLAVEIPLRVPIMTRNMRFALKAMKEQRSLQEALSIKCPNLKTLVVYVVRS